MDSLDNKIRVPTKCYWKINGTINIPLPTDIRKEDSAYDLTLAIGILAASEQIAGASELEDYYIMGNCRWMVRCSPAHCPSPWKSANTRRKG